MSHWPIVLGLHVQNILPVIVLSAFVILLFAWLSFQVTTMNGAWRELSRAYRLWKELEWKR